MTNLDPTSTLPKTKPAPKAKTTKAPAKAKTSVKAKAAPKTQPKKTQKAKVNKDGKRRALLPSIARELGMDPKKARMTLRKAHGSAWRELGEKELRAELAA